MMNDFLITMKPELMMTIIIFILLFIKIAGRMKQENLLTLIQALLLVNFIAGFS